MSTRSTEADLDLVNYIISHTEEYGWPPSRRQIAEHLGVNVNSVQKRLERLVREGIIERGAGVPRAIRINRDRINQLGGN